MYQNILVPIDLNDSSFSAEAVKQAVVLATMSKATLNLVTVIPGVNMPMVASYFPESVVKEIAKDSRKQLEHFAHQHVKGDIDIVIHVEQGKPSKEIVRCAKSCQADLIVIPSHKRTRLDKVMLGSVAARVVDRAPMSVMVIKPSI